MPGPCWLAVNSTLHYYYHHYYYDDDDYYYYYYYYYFFFALSIHPLAPYILYLGLLPHEEHRPSTTSRGHTRL